MPTGRQFEDLLTVKELSAKLRIHPSTLYRMLKRSNLPRIKIGSDWRFRYSAVLEWLETLKSRTH